MVSKRITFIVNPAAGNGTTGREWPRMRAKAKERLGAFETLMTIGPADATRLARRAVLSGADILVCVGGDGTLNEVVNGMMDENGPLEPGVLLGYLPRGTGCDLPRSMAIPRDLDMCLENIITCQNCFIDLGKLTFQAHDGRPSSRYFHNMLSFGLGGEVDERVNRTSKIFSGSLTYIWATLISILRYEKKRIRLCVDDCFEEEFTIWNVAVANGQYHGGGMWVAPGAALSDGLFQITVIGDLYRAEVFWNLPRLYNGKIYEHEKITRLSGRRIMASSFQQVLLDIDGEQPGRLPVAIEMFPSALRIICANQGGHP